VLANSKLEFGQPKVEVKGGIYLENFLAQRKKILKRQLNLCGLLKYTKDSEVKYTKHL